MKQTTVIRSGGNIFADLGLPNADEHMLKAHLVLCLDEMIEQAGLTQHAAAKKMGISTTLADLLRPPLVANPFSTMRASLRR